MKKGHFYLYINYNSKFKQDKWLNELILIVFPPCFDTSYIFN